MDYPDELLRGISNSDYVNEGGPDAQAFTFDDKCQREDGFMEMSINWYDEKEALNYTMNQRKEDGTIQFKGGVAILSREKLDKYVVPSKQAYERFDYERKPINGNKYHGNLLLLKGTRKSIKRMISGAIAFCVVDLQGQS